MNIFQVVSLGLVIAILSITLRQNTPQFAMALGIVGSVLMLWLILPQLAQVLQVFTKISTQINVNSEHIKIIFKIIGIAFVGEFGGQICHDAGESAIAYKIEIAAKILIMIVSFPILLSLMDLIMTMLPV